MRNGLLIFVRHRSSRRESFLRLESKGVPGDLIDSGMLSDPPVLLAPDTLQKTTASREKEEVNLRPTSDFCGLVFRLAMAEKCPITVGLFSADDV